MTMFNILLIIAGILEYILLGVNFKVSGLPCSECAMRLTPQKDNFPNTYLGGILIGVAFLNALIEFYQLQKSEAILASFLAMIPPSCRVVRDGSLITVPAADLVKGDIVLVVRVPFTCEMRPISMSEWLVVSLWRQNSRRPGSLCCI